VITFTVPRRPPFGQRILRPRPQGAAPMSAIPAAPRSSLSCAPGAVPGRLGSDGTREAVGEGCKPRALPA